MIPNFDIAKIRGHLSKTSPQLNLKRLRALSRSLNRSSLEKEGVVLEQSTGPQPYETVGNVFSDYGLIANERFYIPSQRPFINRLPKNLRWIDESQYDRKRLKGYHWGKAAYDYNLPPFYMVLGKTKYWPAKSHSLTVSGERDHDEVLLDIVNNFFEKTDVLPSVKDSFFVGTMNQLLDGTKIRLPLISPQTAMNQIPFLPLKEFLDQPPSIFMNGMLILDNVKELNNYPFLNLRPIAYYENDIAKIRFMREMMKNRSQEYNVQPKMKTYEEYGVTKHHNTRDHIALFVSSIMPTFGNIYSNYPLDKLYPHVFKKGVE